MIAVNSFLLCNLKAIVGEWHTESLTLLHLNPSNFAHFFAVIGSNIGTVNQEKKCMLLVSNPPFVVAAIYSCYYL